MNDPGLDDPIAEDSKDVDVEHQKKTRKTRKTRKMRKRRINRRFLNQG
jgi:hypothetical protein